MKLYIYTAITVLLIASCTDSENKTTPGTPPIPVTISNNEDSSSENYIMASGKTESINSATISTRMMGYVSQIHVTTGKKVSDGQLLVSITNTDLLAKKAQAEAGIQQALKSYENAKKDFERFTELFKNQSASEKELDDITTRYEMSKAALEGARAIKNEVMSQLIYSDIRAPFSGTITNTFLKQGDLANPGMPILSIEGGKGIQATVMVTEREIIYIKEGMPVKVTVKSSAEILDGKVIEISTSSKNTGSVYLVKVSLSNESNSVYPGMFINVQFPIPTATRSTTVRIADKALIRHGQLTGVYTIGYQNKALLRWIRTGKRANGFTEVLSGLSAEEKYIVTAEGKLYNGALISIKDNK